MVWLWNIGLVFGLGSMLLGYNQGLEAGELPLLIDIVIFIVVSFTTYQFIVTIARRLEPQLYVALWYLIAAFVWTRSEEHTSELQSLMRISYAVFSLKKK